ncbi:MAG: hypothetical protein ACHQYP_05970 [Nitrospiria bacterium]
MKEQNCYECVHRGTLPGDCHSRCNNHEANVKGNAHGIKNGWFKWPYNFDPTWLISCDGFSNNPEDEKPPAKSNPLAELLAMLR